MPRLHYVVRRTRFGKFCFTLMTSTGRLTGSVLVPITGQTSDELTRQGQEKIRALAAELLGAKGVKGNYVRKPYEKGVRLAQTGKLHKTACQD